MSPPSYGPSGTLCCEAEGSLVSVEFQGMDATLGKTRSWVRPLPLGFLPWHNLWY